MEKLRYLCYFIGVFLFLFIHLLFDVKLVLCNRIRNINKYMQWSVYITVYNGDKFVYLILIPFFFFLKVKNIKDKDFLFVVK